MMYRDHEFNVVICATTNSPCSYCQPVCDHRIICDRCRNRQCMSNFNGWCRHMLHECFLRRHSKEMREAWEQRKTQK